MKKCVVAWILVLLLLGSASSAMAEWGDWLGGLTSIFSAEEEVTYGVGELASTGDVEIKLINVMQSNGSSFYKPESGKKFVILEFEVKNTGRRELVLSTMLSFQAWCDDKRCEISLDALALAMMNGKYQLDTVVEPGKTICGVIGYEVPSDWLEIKVEYSEDMFLGEWLVFLIESKDE